MSATWIVAASAMLGLTACGAPRAVCTAVKKVVYDPREPHYACPTGNGYARPMGWISDPSSALNESEARLSADVGDLAPDEGDYRVVGTASAGARYSGETVTFHADVNPGAVEGPDDALILGNVRVGMGLRTIGTNLGGLYRRGLAIRAALGIDPMDGASDRLTSAELAYLRPMDRLRFGSGQTYEQVLEARYELIGCHAPFVHVQAGFRARKDADASTFTAPFSITVGAHPNAGRYWKRIPHMTAYLEYASVVGRLPTSDDEIRLAQRARAGLVLDDYYVAIHVDSLFGVGDGVLFGATAAVPLDWGR